MVKISRRLLPLKAHYFFFFAGLGPILPQLSVIGKQIGVSPEEMGYITSVLPIMYVIAKPLFGFVADYFVRLRKYIFLLLIIAMTLAYGAFYFIPNESSPEVKPQEIPQNITLNIKSVNICSPELQQIRKLYCSNRGTSFEAYMNDVDIKTVKDLDTPSNLTTPLSTSTTICLSPDTKELIWNKTFLEIGSINVSCQLISNGQIDSIYGTWTFWLFVILLYTGTIGFNVANSISDAICFDMLGETGGDKYGAQRLWGTIGFGVTALLGGVAVNLWTDEVVKSLTPALFIMFIFSGLDLLSITKLKLPPLMSNETILKDVWDLITHPSIAIFLVFATLAGIIDSFVIYFMFWHMEEVAAETGYMDQIKLIEGCVVAAECLGGEILFFFYSGKIIKKLGYVHSMNCCFFFYAVRLALISWIPNPWYLVGIEFFFQGCTYALCYTCIVAYAAAVAPPGTSATVQGIMAGMDDGLGFSIGSLIGGLAFKTFGGRRSFAYFSILAICTCVAHIIIRPFSKKNQYLPKIGYELPKGQSET